MGSSDRPDYLLQLRLVVASHGEMDRTRPVEELAEERTSRAVQSARDDLLAAR